MANNYTPSYNQYRTQTAGYALPSSVRSYSVFDPASSSWRRMTNDGRSPIPAQGQAVVPVQGMGQGQPVEVHPGYVNPPVQGVNTPLRQTIKPLAKSNQKNNTYKPNPVEVATTLVAPARNTANLNITPNFNNLGWGTQEVVPRLYTEGLKLPNPIRHGARIPTQVNVDPAEIGQSAPIAEVTPIIRGNGFLTWLGDALGFNSSSNTDPYLQNYSDPRW